MYSYTDSWWPFLHQNNAACSLDCAWKGWILAAWTAHFPFQTQDTTVSTLCASEDFPQQAHWQIRYQMTFYVKWGCHWEGEIYYYSTYFEAF